MDIFLKDISMHYTLKKALDGVSVDFTGGKIHALLGENGAGKSTLASIVSGALLPTSGKLFIDGCETSFESPGDALKKGIATVQQRPLLSSSITARENILLSLRSSLFTTPKRLLELRETWCPDLDLEAKVKDLGGNHRFYIALLKALLKNPRCLILDEPSAFLDIQERKKLYASLKEEAQRGTNIIVITHSTAEAVNFTDDVVLLKKGTLYKTYSSSSEYEKDMDKAAIPSFSAVTAPSSGNARPEKCLELVHAVSRPRNRPALLDATLEVYYGEITAVSGLKEAAIDTLEDLVTGMEPYYARGTAFMHDRNGKVNKINLGSASLTMGFLRKHRTAVIPSDRSFRGSNPNLTVEELLNPYNDEGSTFSRAMELIRQSDVNITPREKASALSGGMLQRLILAREISTDPDFIILCNPLQGLDISSQGRVSRQILDLSAQGKAVLIIGAEDFPLTLCSKVYNLEGGVLKLSYSKEKNI